VRSVLCTALIAILFLVALLWGLRSVMLVRADPGARGTASTPCKTISHTQKTQASGEDTISVAQITFTPSFTTYLPAIFKNSITGIGAIVTREIEYGQYLQYIPTTFSTSSEIIVIVHGTPGENETALELAIVFINRWVPLAEERGAILIAPAFDQENFGSREGPGGGYRGLYGREIGADDFVHLILENYATILSNFDGRFYLYGHSAGGQFVNRYVVRHPYRIKAAVVSAAGRYAYPNPDVAWPYGMGRIQRTMQWPGSDEIQYIDITPDPNGWIAAAVSTLTVVVGENDTEPQPSRPGQKGTTRIEIGQNWVNDMNSFALEHNEEGTVEFILVPDVGHSSAGLTPTCQDALFR
jgi:poly(3-hydroxybutyrate) depolymerase